MYFNPPAPCGTGPYLADTVQRNHSISIHPPLAGRDERVADFAPRFRNFNPPAPCGTGRKGATVLCTTGYFNPPAPCGTGLVATAAVTYILTFQSTRPLRDGTIGPFRVLVLYPLFQSTRPLRDGTGLPTYIADSLLFQSTRPLRDGTRAGWCYMAVQPISIHPPLAGRDNQFVHHLFRPYYFNPPAPCGTGHGWAGDNAPKWEFQSTRPLRDGTVLSVREQVSYRDFNPPAPCGTGQMRPDRILQVTKFQSTRPLRDGTCR